MSEWALRKGVTPVQLSMLGRYAWFGENFSTGGTHPVGQKLPNPWGLYDIQGNAWKWVQDRYSDDYYAQRPENDPKGLDSGSQYVVRGSSWHVTADSWRSSFRKLYAADYRGISIGFRFVMAAQ